MTAGDKYSAKVLELLARAETETDPTIRAEFENLAAAFMRLAEQAERNSRFIIDIDLLNETDRDPKTKH